MSGIFTIGGAAAGGGGDTPCKNNIPTNGGLFLYKNDEIYSKSLDLWQQGLQQRGGQSMGNGGYYSAVGGTLFNLFEDQARSGTSVGMIRHGGGGGGGSSTAAGGGVNCQDCGNQAKKDCIHLRCRTCCKSRGFHCPTHVKSTWVPAAKRRERQQQTLVGGGVDGSKRPRDDPGSSSSLLCTRFSTDSGMEVGNFPAEVNSQALFRCVRLGSMDESDDQYAYQPVVNIGGHIFKGILYDHGMDGGGGGYGGGGGESSSPGGRQQLDLITAGGGSSGRSQENMDHTLYAAPLNAFMAGTPFFPGSRS